MGTAGVARRVTELRGHLATGRRISITGHLIPARRSVCVHVCVCVCGWGGGVAKKNRIFKLMFTEASAEGASL